MFRGRARREEYWMFTLLSSVIYIVVMIIDAGLGAYGLIDLVYYLGILLPTLAVTVRRLHDTGRSGWWLLIGLVPVVGFIVLLVFLVTAGKETNAYGPNPKFAVAD